MSLTDLLPALHALPRREKLQVIQVLVADMAREDEPSLDATSDHILWSPYDAHDAAATLLRILDEESTPTV